MSALTSTCMLTHILNTPAPYSVLSGLTFGYWDALKMHQKSASIGKPAKKRSSQGWNTWIHLKAKHLFSLKVIYPQTHIIDHKNHSVRLPSGQGVNLMTSIHHINYKQLCTNGQVSMWVSCTVGGWNAKIHFLLLNRICIWKLLLFFTTEVYFTNSPKSYINT